MRQLELPLFVPDRFDSLREYAEDAGLKNIVIPVEETLNYLDDTFDDIRASGRGAFWIFRGQSGSGKSTFLHTAFLFRENVETISILNDTAVAEGLVNLKSIHFQKAYQIIVIEGREALTDFSKEQLERDIHSINNFIRSSYGRSSLIVWTCNTEELQNILIQLANNIGADSLLGVGEPVYSFTGPPSSNYINIANRTIATLNEGASLIDLGISEELSQQLVSRANTIGHYLNLLRQELRKNEKTVKALLDKELCRMWVVVITGNDREDFVTSLTRGRASTADIERLIVATEANVVQELKAYPDKIGILATALDARIIHIPILTVLAIAREYADEKLQDKMKELGMSLKKDSTANERLIKSELAKAFKSETIGLGVPGNKPGESTREAFEKLLSIAQNDDQVVNETLGRALVAGGLVDSYESEVDFGKGLTRRTDLLCETKLGRVRLELMWRKSTGRAEIANYVLTKLYNYGKAIEFLE
jgi:DNA (cytosine-5)-methyltransferase 1